MKKNIKDEITDDLKKALTSWDQISKDCESEGLLSADERALEDMKTLLKRLQEKIQEFET